MLLLNKLLSVTSDRNWLNNERLEWEKIKVIHFSFFRIYCQIQQMSSVCLERIIHSFSSDTRVCWQEHYRLVYDCFLVRFYWFVSRGWEFPPWERVEKNKPVSILTHLQSCVISVRRLKLSHILLLRALGLGKLLPLWQVYTNLLLYISVCVWWQRSDNIQPSLWTGLCTHTHTTYMSTSGGGVGGKVGYKFVISTHL